jgi:hypothetical protein
MEVRNSIPFYKEINDFLKSIPSDYLSTDPKFLLPAVKRK